MVEKANDLKEIMKVINLYCFHEFGSDADFSDMHNVGLAFTTLKDHEIPIQVSIDLIKMKIRTWIGDVNCSDDSLVDEIDVTVKEIKENSFDFDSLISGWQNYIEDNIDKYIGGK